MREKQKERKQFTDTPPEEAHFIDIYFYIKLLFKEIINKKKEIWINLFYHYL